MESKAVEQAVKVLREGGVVAYPTETFYGLAADPLQPKALAKLNDLKRERGSKGYTMLIPNLAALKPMGIKPLPFEQRLMEIFWPGPLTLVLRANRRWLNAVGVGGNVALRMSPQPLAKALTAAFGAPITATSANPSGMPPAAEPSQIKAYFGDAVYLLDGGITLGSAPSTLVKVARLRQELQVLRMGAIPIEALVQLAWENGFSLSHP